MKLDLLQTVLASQPNLTALFGPHLSSSAQVIPPSTSNFSTLLQQRWTDYNAPSFSLGAIKPATERDVQETVRIASAYEIPFFVTGGGHGISDYHAFDGLAIDLGAFKHVSVAESGSHMTIGGSVKIHQLIQPLYEAGKELPLGSCACVGVVGATLGGGIGGLQGHRGLMLDSLESVRIVTAAGDLLHASRSENQDLFWALRGAGSNYGIVTSATFVLPDISNNGLYMNADFIIPASANVSFFQVMKVLEHGMPSRLAISAGVVYNRVANEPMIAVNAIYYGPREEGEVYLKAFKDLQPTKSNISMVPAHDIMDAAYFRSFGQDNGACTPNQHINIYSMALKRIHTPTFESFFARLVDFWKAYPGFQGRWLLQRYATQGPRAVSDSETAYGLRDAQLYMNFEGFYTDTDLDEPVNAFLGPAREEFAKVGGYGRLAVYPNYARGDEGAEAWYGAENLPRLAAIKRKYDPKERFSLHVPVPLQWP
ncbi:MAG: hypothetical protein Q9169_007296 [Polycauliona sp. 2 TL-2023]